MNRWKIIIKINSINKYVRPNIKTNKGNNTDVAGEKYLIRNYLLGSVTDSIFLEIVQFYSNIWREDILKLIRFSYKWRWSVDFIKSGLNLCLEIWLRVCCYFWKWINSCFCPFHPLTQILHRLPQFIL